MRAYDRSLWLRCVGVGALLGVITFGVMVATDEGGSTPAMRLARLCAFTPALAALGAAATVELARGRGELRALEALGISPWRTALGAALGAWFLGALAIAGLALPWTDIAALFPSVASSDIWIAQAGHPQRLVDPVNGVAVSADGALSWVGAQPLVRMSSAGRHAALSCFAPLALVTPVWITVPVRVAERAIGVALSFAFAVFLLHAVAAGRNAVWALPLAAVPLAVSAARSWRRNP